MSSTFKDYYATLGLSREATSAEIKKAFRKLARIHHPDVAKDKQSAEAKFKEINEAHEVLSDPEKRRKYNELGADWASGGGRPARSGSGQDREFNFGGTGFSDFFEEYFSGASRYGFPAGSGPSTQQAGRRGSDIEGDILVTLEEAMQGSVRSISLQIRQPGSGAVETHTVQVRIPAGVTDGKRIRVPGQGENGKNGMSPGDLYLRVRHAAHPDFRSVEKDLYYDLDLAPWEAILGVELSVPTLDGPVKLRVPAFSDSGNQLRVRGRGLPGLNQTGRGDFFAVLNVQLPENLTDEERGLWEKLRDLSNFRPRNQESI